jgi:CTD small phosphatase-like protein 2
VFRKKTLIFDLDETLIHCLDESELSHNFRGDLSVEVPYVDEDDLTEGFVTAEINLRPHLMETLDHLRQFYQLVIFTASEKSYADSILNIIDPLG